jgi:hypothetical protein
MSQLRVDLSNVAISLELGDICDTDKAMTPFFVYHGALWSSSVAKAARAWKPEERGLTSFFPAVDGRPRANC